MGCPFRDPGKGTQESIEASGALSSVGLNMGWPGWERVWTVRVVWISFRPSEPETWVRILHGPPLNLSFTGGFDDITEDLSTLSEGTLLSLEVDVV